MIDREISLKRCSSFNVRAKSSTYTAMNNFEAVERAKRERSALSQSTSVSQQQRSVSSRSTVESGSRRTEKQKRTCCRTSCEKREQATTSVHRPRRSNPLPSLSSPEVVGFSPIITD